MDCVFVFALQIYKIFHTKAIAIPLIIKRIAILFDIMLTELYPPQKTEADLLGQPPVAFAPIISESELMPG